MYGRDYSFGRMTLRHCFALAIPTYRSEQTELKIVIPGGSGQVGTLLARALTSASRDVVVLRRKPRADPWRVPVCDGGDHR